MVLDEKGKQNEEEKKRRRTKVRRYGLGSTYFLQILPTPEKESAKNLILSLSINT